MSNRKVYISGPITGLPQLNKPAFDTYSGALSLSGVDHFNPHTIPAPAAPLEGKALWQYYMRECVKQLPDCTEIHMLPGWHMSEGATEELRIARILGINAVFIPPFFTISSPI